MGSASPVMPSGEPCWDTALATDTSTKAASRATVGAVCSALLCMESALGGGGGGRREMSNVLNNKMPGCWDPRQEARCGHPSKTLELSIRSWQTVQPTPTPSAIHPYQSCVWVGPGWACSSVLCSALVDLTAVTGEGYSLSASLHTHNDPIAPACLTNQLLRSATNRQGGENKLTVSLVRHLHFTLHMRRRLFFCPQITELIEILRHRLYFLFLLHLKRQDGRKIGQTPRRCVSTENGCCGGRVLQNGGLQ